MPICIVFNIITYICMRNIEKQCSFAYEPTVLLFVCSFALYYF